MLPRVPLFQLLSLPCPLLGFLKCRSTPPLEQHFLFLLSPLHALALLQYCVLSSPLFLAFRVFFISVFLFFCVFAFVFKIPLSPRLSHKFFLLSLSLFVVAPVVPQCTDRKREELSCWFRGGMQLEFPPLTLPDPRMKECLLYEDPCSVSPRTLAIALLAGVVSRVGHLTDLLPGSGKLNKPALHLLIPAAAQTSSSAASLIRDIEHADHAQFHTFKRDFGLKRNCVSSDMRKQEEKTHTHTLHVSYH